MAGESALPVKLIDPATNEPYVAGAGMGGTQYDEDTASADAQKLTMAGVTRANTAASQVGSDGDRSTLIVDQNGRLHVNDSAPAIAAAPTSVNSSASSVTLLAANAARRGAMVYNTDANALYLKFGAIASATSFTVKIPADGYYEFPRPVYTGVVDGIWAADGAGIAAITEIT